MLKSLQNRAVFLLSIVMLIVVSDQLTKQWAQRTLAYEYAPTQFFQKKEIVVIPYFFNLIYKENTAAAFSMTSSIPEWFRKPFLLTVSLMATLFFIIWYFRLKEEEQHGLLMTA